MRKAIAVGMFDGVHRGHQFLLRGLREEAARRGLQPVAVTFASHPAALTRPGAEPMLLQDLDERLDTLHAAGVETLVLDFNPELRRLTAEEFLRKMHAEHEADFLLLGFNNRLGSDRLGFDSPELDEACRRVGVELLRMPPLPGLEISSSAIRRAIAEGDMEGAAEMLGRPYELEGKVVEGRRIGRTIGVPTANIQVDSHRLLPANGVYLGRMLGHKAVVNIGRRPTVDHSARPEVTVEAHLLDFDGDLYGKTVRLELLRRLRSERKFNGLDELKEAIANDILQAYESDI